MSSQGLANTNSDDHNESGLEADHKMHCPNIDTTSALRYQENRHQRQVSGVLTSRKITPRDYPVDILSSMTIIQCSSDLSVHEEPDNSGAFDERRQDHHDHHNLDDVDNPQDLDMLNAHQHFNFHSITLDPTSFHTMHRTLSIDTPPSEAPSTKSPTALPLFGKKDLFQIRGVGYQPTPVGKTPFFAPHDQDGDFFGHAYMHLHLRDLDLMRSVGINTIRLWGWNEQIDHTQFLDHCYNNGVNPIYVAITFVPEFGVPEYAFDPDDDRRTEWRRVEIRFAEIVKKYQDHPAVLMWLIGNEPNRNMSTFDSYMKLVSRLASIRNILCSTETSDASSPPASSGHAPQQSSSDGDQGKQKPACWHPISVPLAEPANNSTFIPLLSHVERKYPHAVDIYSLQLYRGHTLGNVFQDMQFLHYLLPSSQSKPLLITEFGLDVIDFRVAPLPHSIEALPDGDRTSINTHDHPDRLTSPTTLLTTQNNITSGPSERFPPTDPNYHPLLNETMQSNAIINMWHEINDAYFIPPLDEIQVLSFITNNSHLIDTDLDRLLESRMSQIDPELIDLVTSLLDLKGFTQRNQSASPPHSTTSGDSSISTDHDYPRFRPSSLLDLSQTTTAMGRYNKTNPLCVGGFVFEWHDEHWKATMPSSNKPIREHCPSNDLAQHSVCGFPASESALSIPHTPAFVYLESSETLLAELENSVQDLPPVPSVSATTPSMPPSTRRPPRPTPSVSSPPTPREYNSDPQPPSYEEDSILSSEPVIDAENHNDDFRNNDDDIIEEESGFSSTYSAEQPSSSVYSPSPPISSPPVYSPPTWNPTPTPTTPTPTPVYPAPPSSPAGPQPSRGASRSTPSGLSSPYTPPSSSAVGVSRPYTPSLSPSPSAPRPPTPAIGLSSPYSPPPPTNNWGAGYRSPTSALFSVLSINRRTPFTEENRTRTKPVPSRANMTSSDVVLYNEQLQPHQHRRTSPYFDHFYSTAWMGLFQHDLANTPRYCLLPRQVLFELQAMWNPERSILRKFVEERHQKGKPSEKGAEDPVITRIRKGVIPPPVLRIFEQEFCRDQQCCAYKAPSAMAFWGAIIIILACFFLIFSRFRGSPVSKLSHSQWKRLAKYLTPAQAKKSSKKNAADFHNDLASKQGGKQGVSHHLLAYMPTVEPPVCNIPSITVAAKYNANWLALLDNAIKLHQHPIRSPGIVITPGVFLSSFPVVCSSSVEEMENNSFLASVADNKKPSGRESISVMAVYPPDLSYSLISGQQSVQHPIHLMAHTGGTLHTRILTTSIPSPFIQLKYHIPRGILALIPRPVLYDAISDMILKLLYASTGLSHPYVSLPSNGSDGNDIHRHCESHTSMFQSWIFTLVNRPQRDHVHSTLDSATKTFESWLKPAHGSSSSPTILGHHQSSNNGNAVNDAESASQLPIRPSSSKYTSTLINHHLNLVPSLHADSTIAFDYFPLVQKLISTWLIRITTRCEAVLRINLLKRDPRSSKKSSGGHSHGSCQLHDTLNLLATILLDNPQSFSTASIPHDKDSVFPSPAPSDIRQSNETNDIDDLQSKRSTDITLHHHMQFLRRQYIHTTLSRALHQIVLLGSMVSAIDILFARIMESYHGWCKYVNVQPLLGNVHLPNGTALRQSFHSLNVNHTSTYQNDGNASIKAVLRALVTIEYGNRNGNDSTSASFQTTKTTVQAKSIRETPTSSFNPQLIRPVSKLVLMSIYSLVWLTSAHLKRVPALVNQRFHGLLDHFLMAGTLITVSKAVHSDIKARKTKCMKDYQRMMRKRQTSKRPSRATTSTEKSNDALSCQNHTPIALASYYHTTICSDNHLPRLESPSPSPPSQSHEMVQPQDSHHTLPPYFCHQNLPSYHHKTLSAFTNAIDCHKINYDDLDLILSSHFYRQTYEVTDSKTVDTIYPSSMQILEDSPITGGGNIPSNICYRCLTYCCPCVWCCRASGKPNPSTWNLAASLESITPLDRVGLYTTRNIQSKLTLHPRSGGVCGLLYAYWFLIHLHAVLFFLILGTVRSFYIHLDMGLSAIALHLMTAAGYTTIRLMAFADLICLALSIVAFDWILLRSANKLIRNLMTVIVCVGLVGVLWLMPASLDRGATSLSVFPQILLAMPPHLPSLVTGMKSSSNAVATPIHQNESMTMLQKYSLPYYILLVRVLFLVIVTIYNIYHNLIRSYGHLPSSYHYEQKSVFTTNDSDTNHTLLTKPPSDHPSQPPSLMSSLLPLFLYDDGTSLPQTTNDKPVPQAPSLTKKRLYLLTRSILFLACVIIFKLYFDAYILLPSISGITYTSLCRKPALLGYDSLSLLLTSTNLPSQYQDTSSSIAPDFFTILEPGYGYRFLSLVAFSPYATCHILVTVLWVIAFIMSLCTTYVSYIIVSSMFWLFYSILQQQFAKYHQITALRFARLIFVISVIVFAVCALLGSLIHAIYAWLPLFLVSILISWAAGACPQGGVSHSRSIRPAPHPEASYADTTSDTGRGSRSQHQSPHSDVGNEADVPLQTNNSWVDEINTLISQRSRQLRDTIEKMEQYHMSDVNMLITTEVIQADIERTTQLMLSMSHGDLINGLAADSNNHHHTSPPRLPHQEIVDDVVASILIQYQQQHNMAGLSIDSPLSSQEYYEYLHSLAYVIGTHGQVKGDEDKSMDLQQTRPMGMAMGPFHILYRVLYHSLRPLKIHHETIQTMSHENSTTLNNSFEQLPPRRHQTDLTINIEHYFISTGRNAEGNTTHAVSEHRLDRDKDNQLLYDLDLQTKSIINTHHNQQAQRIHSLLQMDYEGGMPSSSSSSSVSKGILLTQSAPYHSTDFYQTSLVSNRHNRPQSTSGMDSHPSPHHRDRDRMLHSIFELHSALGESLQLIDCIHTETSIKPVHSHPSLSTFLSSSDKIQTLMSEITQSHNITIDITAFLHHCLDQLHDISPNTSIFAQTQKTANQPPSPVGHMSQSAHDDLIEQFLQAQNMSDLRHILSTHSINDPVILCCLALVMIQHVKSIMSPSSPQSSASNPAGAPTRAPCPYALLPHEIVMGVASSQSDSLHLLQSYPFLQIISTPISPSHMSFFDCLVFILIGQLFTTLECRRATPPFLVNSGDADHISSLSGLSGLQHKESDPLNESSSDPSWEDAFHHTLHTIPTMLGLPINDLIATSMAHLIVLVFQCPLIINTSTFSYSLPVNNMNTRTNTTTTNPRSSPRETPDLVSSTTSSSIDDDQEQKYATILDSHLHQVSSTVNTLQQECCGRGSILITLSRHLHNPLAVSKISMMTNSPTSDDPPALCRSLHSFFSQLAQKDEADVPHISNTQYSIAWFQLLSPFCVPMQLTLVTYARLSSQCQSSHQPLPPVHSQPMPSYQESLKIEALSSQHNIPSAPLFSRFVHSTVINTESSSTVIQPYYSFENLDYILALTIHLQRVFSHHLTPLQTLVVWSNMLYHFYLEDIISIEDARYFRSLLSQKKSNGGGSSFPQLSFDRMYSSKHLDTLTGPQLLSRLHQFSVSTISFQAKNRWNPHPLQFTHGISTIVPFYQETIIYSFTDLITPSQDPMSWSLVFDEEENTRGNATKASSSSLSPARLRQYYVSQMGHVRHKNNDAQDGAYSPIQEPKHESQTNVSPDAPNPPNSGVDILSRIDHLDDALLLMRLYQSPTNQGATSLSSTPSHYSSHHRRTMIHCIPCQLYFLPDYGITPLEYLVGLVAHTIHFNKFAERLRFEGTVIVDTFGRLFIISPTGYTLGNPGDDASTQDYLNLIGILSNGQHARDHSYNYLDTHRNDLHTSSYQIDYAFFAQSFQIVDNIPPRLSMNAYALLLLLLSSPLDVSFAPLVIPDTKPLQGLHLQHLKAITAITQAQDMQCSDQHSFSAASVGPQSTCNLPVNADIIPMSFCHRKVSVAYQLIINSICQWASMRGQTLIKTISSLHHTFHAYDTFLAFEQGCLPVFALPGTQNPPPLQIMKTLIPGKDQLDSTSTSTSSQSTNNGQNDIILKRTFPTPLDILQRNYPHLTSLSEHEPWSQHLNLNGSNVGLMEEHDGLINHELYQIVIGAQVLSQRRQHNVAAVRKPTVDRNSHGHKLYDILQETVAGIDSHVARQWLRFLTRLRAEHGGHTTLMTPLHQGMIQLLHSLGTHHQVDVVYHYNLQKDLTEKLHEMSKSIFHAVTFPLLESTTSEIVRWLHGHHQPGHTAADSMYHHHIQWPMDFGPGAPTPPALSASSTLSTIQSTLQTPKIQQINLSYELNIMLLVNTTLFTINTPIQEYFSKTTCQFKGNTRYLLNAMLELCTPPDTGLAQQPTNPLNDAQDHLAVMHGSLSAGLTTTPFFLNGISLELQRLYLLVQSLRHCSHMHSSLGGALSSIYLLLVTAMRQFIHYQLTRLDQMKQFLSVVHQTFSLVVRIDSFSVSDHKQHDNHSDSHPTILISVIDKLLIDIETLMTLSTPSCIDSSDLCSLFRDFIMTWRARLLSSPSKLSDQQTLRRIKTDLLRLVMMTFLFVQHTHTHICSGSIQTVLLLFRSISGVSFLTSSPHPHAIDAPTRAQFDDEQEWTEGQSTHLHSAAPHSQWYIPLITSPLLWVTNTMQQTHQHVTALCGCLGAYGLLLSSAQAGWVSHWIDHHNTHGSPASNNAPWCHIEKRIVVECMDYHDRESVNKISLRVKCQDLTQNTSLDDNIGSSLPVSTTIQSQDDGGGSVSFMVDNTNVTVYLLASETSNLSTRHSRQETNRILALIQSIRSPPSSNDIISNTTHRELHYPCSIGTKTILPMILSLYGKQYWSISTSYTPHTPHHGTLSSLSDVFPTHYFTSSDYDLLLGGGIPYITGASVLKTNAKSENQLQCIPFCFKSGEILQTIDMNQGMRYENALFVKAIAYEMKYSDNIRMMQLGSSQMLLTQRLLLQCVVDLLSQDSSSTKDTNGSQKPSAVSSKQNESAKDKNKNIKGENAAQKEGQLPPERGTRLEKRPVLKPNPNASLMLTLLSPTVSVHHGSTHSHITTHFTWYHDHSNSPMKDVLNQDPRNKMPSQHILFPDMAESVPRSEQSSEESSEHAPNSDDHDVTQHSNDISTTGGQGIPPIAHSMPSSSTMTMVKEHPICTLQIKPFASEYLLIACPERIFTKHANMASFLMAQQDSSFTTTIQQMLNFTGSRQHYGHPDMISGLARFRVCLSKASPEINLSEDIFLGFDLNSRFGPGRTNYVDYIQYDKGRDVSLVSISIFLTKLSRGCGVLFRSGDVYRILRASDPISSILFLLSTVSHYVYSVVFDLTIESYVWIILLIACSNIRSESIGILGSVYAIPWLLHLGYFFAFPLLSKLIAKYGVIRGIGRFVMITITGLFYYIFTTRITAINMWQSLQSQTASSYLATGRNFSVNPRESNTLVTFFILYTHTHYYHALRLMFVIACYVFLLSSHHEPFFYTILLKIHAIVIAIFAWLLSPIIYTNLFVRSQSYQQRVRSHRAICHKIDAVTTSHPPPAHALPILNQTSSGSSFSKTVRHLRMVWRRTKSLWNTVYQWTQPVLTRAYGNNGQRSIQVELSNDNYHSYISWWWREKSETLRLNITRMIHKINQRFALLPLAVPGHIHPAVNAPHTIDHTQQQPPPQQQQQQQQQPDDAPATAYDEEIEMVDNLDMVSRDTTAIHVGDHNDDHHDMNDTLFNTPNAIQCIDPPSSSSRWKNEYDEEKEAKHCDDIPENPHITKDDHTTSGSVASGGVVPLQVALHSPRHPQHHHTNNSESVIATIFSAVHEDMSSRMPSSSSSTTTTAGTTPSSSQQGTALPRNITVSIFGLIPSLCKAVLLNLPWIWLACLLLSLIHGVLLHVVVYLMVITILSIYAGPFVVVITGLSFTILYLVFQSLNLWNYPTKQYLIQAYFLPLQAIRDIFILGMILLIFYLVFCSIVEDLVDQHVVKRVAQQYFDYVNAVHQCIKHHCEIISLLNDQHGGQHPPGRSTASSVPVARELPVSFNPQTLTYQYMMTHPFPLMHYLNQYSPQSCTSFYSSIIPVNVWPAQTTDDSKSTLFRSLLSTKWILKIFRPYWYFQCTVITMLLTAVQSVVYACCLLFPNAHARIMSFVDTSNIIQ